MRHNWSSKASDSSRGRSQQCPGHQRKTRTPCAQKDGMRDLQSVARLATLITKTAIRENQNEKGSLTKNLRQ